MGVGLARILPNKEFAVAGKNFNLNPGPFNMKGKLAIPAYRSSIRTAN